MADTSAGKIPSSVNEVRMEFPEPCGPGNETKIPAEAFAEVPLGTLEGGIGKKTPRRVLHFSDGVLEEYSTEEEQEVEEVKENRAVVDPRTLTWFPYLVHMALQIGTKTLAVCDYLGEHLAYFFGITSPKFQYEIEEYNRMVQEETEAKNKLAEQMAGWQAFGEEQLERVTTQPSPQVPPGTSNAELRPSDSSLVHEVTPTPVGSVSMERKRY